MKRSFTHLTGILLAGVAVAALSGCDADIRGTFGGGIDTSSAVRVETAPRPQPDDRGVISYPGYQVAVARSGDTVAAIAARLGIDAASLARYNALDANSPLRSGEIIALPRRVSESPSDDTIDVQTLASDALDRAEPAAQQRRPNLPDTGVEPVRHHVERGETAYSIARLYRVSVRSLAEWNGLGPDLAVREGQYLMIPVVISEPEEPAETQPGEGTQSPIPPSASSPLPEDDTAVEVNEPQSPQLAEQDGVQSNSVLLFPVEGRIIRPFDPQGNGGIDISAEAGAPVISAADGTVAAITEDTNGVPVVVIRHADNILTVYANLDQITVESGDSVTRGQQIAVVRDGTPSFIRFEVRRGFEAIDPMPLLP